MTTITHARGLYTDGWTGLDTYLEVSGEAGTVILLYLPADENALSETKTVILCDGTTTRAVQLMRGTPVNIGLERTTEEIQPLQVYVLEAEPAFDDERVLGVLLRLFDPKGQPIIWTDTADQPRRVAPSALHSDYAFAAIHVNKMQYLLQIDLPQPPVDAVLHFLLVGHLTGAAPNFEVQQETPVEMDFRSENVCLVPPSTALQKLREEATAREKTEKTALSFDEQRMKEADESSLDEEKAKLSAKSLAAGTQAFIEGGFCLSEEHGAGALIFGWALHDPEDEIVLVTERGGGNPNRALFSSCAR